MAATVLEYLTVEKTPVRAYNFEWAQRGAFPLSGDISEYVQVIYANGGHNDDGSYSSETCGQQVCMELCLDVAQNMITKFFR